MQHKLVVGVRKYSSTTATVTTGASAPVVVVAAVSTIKKNCEPNLYVPKEVFSVIRSNLKRIHCVSFCTTRTAYGSK